MGFMDIFGKREPEPEPEWEVPVKEDAPEPYKRGPTEGRPKLLPGEKGKYTLTEAGRRSRRIAALKHGKQSKWLANLVRGCDFCPIKAHCLKKIDMTENEQLDGCQDIRNYYIQKLKEWGDRPMVKIVHEIAGLDMMRDMQMAKDGKSGVISPQYLKLMDLMDKLLNTFHKMGIDPGVKRNVQPMRFDQVEEADVIDVSLMDVVEKSPVEEEKEEVDGQGEPDTQDETPRDT